MKLTCDLCGGTLEMKNGSAVCQGCGLTYSLETLREKMGKPAPAVPADAPVATGRVQMASAHHTNLLNLALLEFNNKNYPKVISTCDQVLASDYANKDAWQLKIRASDVPAGAAAYQAYYASQQTEEGRVQAASFGSQHFSNVKLATIEDEKAVLAIFPDIANSVVNKYLSAKLSDMKKYVAEVRAAQDWETRNKPSTEYEYNEKTTETLRQQRERIGWLNSYKKVLEDYYAYSKLTNSDIGTNLVAYCDAILTWLDLILDFKRWQGEYYRRETVSVYTTKYYYNKHKLVPLLSDTGWEFSACKSMKSTTKTIRSAVAGQNEIKIAQKAAEEKKRVADYWAAHPEEKRELETARAELQKQIETVGEKFRNSYEVRTQKELIEKLEEELKQLKARRNSLGLFSFKEKKTVEAEISNKEVDLSRANRQMNELEYKKNNQVKDIKFKIQKINDRLNLIGVKPKL